MMHEKRLAAPLRDLITTIRRLQSDIGRNLYELGRLLVEVRDHERYGERGYASFGDFAEGELDMARSSAYRTIDIYHHFSPTIAARYGPEKLEAGVALIRATPADERPGDIVAERLRLRAPSGRFVHKTFHDATAAEVWDAVALLAEAKEGRDRIPRALTHRIERLAQRLPGAPRALRAGKRIRLRRDRKSGDVYATFAVIPLSAAALDEFVAVVHELKRLVGSD